MIIYDPFQVVYDLRSPAADLGQRASMVVFIPREA